MVCNQEQKEQAIAEDIGDKILDAVGKEEAEKGLSAESKKLLQHVESTRNNFYSIVRKTNLITDSNKKDGIKSIMKKYSEPLHEFDSVKDFGGLSYEKVNQKLSKFDEEFKKMNERIEKIISTQKENKDTARGY